MQNCGVLFQGNGMRLKASILRGPLLAGFWFVRARLWVLMSLLQLSTRDHWNLMIRRHRRFGNCYLGSSDAGSGRDVQRIGLIRCGKASDGGFQSRSFRHKSSGQRQEPIPFELLVSNHKPRRPGSAIHSSRHACPMSFLDTGAHRCSPAIRSCRHARFLPLRKVCNEQRNSCKRT